MKRILSLCLALLFATPIVSCGKKEEKSRPTNVYSSTDLGLADIRPDSILSDGKKLLVSGTKDSGGEEKYVIASVDIDSGYINDYERVIELSENESVVAVALEPDGNVLLLRSETFGDGSVIWSLDRVSDGEISEVKTDLITLLDSGDSMAARRSTYFGFLAVDGEGRIHVGCSDTIVVLDPDLGKLFEVSVPGRMESLSQTSDGRVYALFRDSDGEQIRFIDAGEKKFGDTLTIPGLYNYQNAYLFAGPGYDLYIKDDDAVRGYDIGGGTYELLNFMNSDFNGNAARYLAVIDPETMVVGCVDYFAAAPEYGVYLMKRIPDDEVPEKTVIKLAYRYSGLPTLRKDVMRFNRRSDEYRIELVDYEKSEPLDEDDYDRSGVLRKDFLSGEAPDIIAASDFSDSVYFAERGMFADLAEYIDDEFRSGYFDSVLRASETDKGQLRTLITSVRPRMIAAGTDFVEPDHWTLDEFLDFAAAVPEGTFIMEYTYPLSMLEFSLSASLDGFIDSGTCDIDTPAFRRLLEYLKTIEKAVYSDTLSGDDLKDYEADPRKPCRDGKVLIRETGASDPRSYLKALTCFGAGKTKFVGYPASSGSGTLIEPRLSLAINQKSEHHDAAWEFIKFVAENGSLDETSFPANLDLFDKLCGEYLGNIYYFEGMASKRYLNSTIEEVKADIKELVKTGNWSGDGDIAVFDKQTAAGLKSLIDGAGYLSGTGMNMIGMIYEEAQMYFSGDKSLDETVKIINDRLTTYFSEKN